MGSREVRQNSKMLQVYIKLYFSYVDVNCVTGLEEYLGYVRVQSKPKGPNLKGKGSTPSSKSS